MEKRSLTPRKRITILDPRSAPFARSFTSGGSTAWSDSRADRL